MKPFYYAIRSVETGGWVEAADYLFLGNMPDLFVDIEQVKEKFDQLIEPTYFAHFVRDESTNERRWLTAAQRTEMMHMDYEIVRLQLSEQGVVKL